MDKAILLAVAASACTATASLCQREGAKDNQTAGFDARLLVRLARRPVLFRAPSLPAAYQENATKPEASR